MKYFWKENVMREEPILFIRRPGELPAGHLLVPAEEIIKVSDASGGKVYEEGRDFCLSGGRRRVVLTENSRIPTLDAAELIRTPGDPHSHRGIRAEDPHLLYCEGSFFPDLQPRFTYRHNGWAGPAPTPNAALLPLTHEKLKNKNPLRMVVFGDSISAGYNATGAINIPPFYPAYDKQAAMELERIYGTEVVCRNVSQNGMNALWARQNISRVLDEKPDLLILAWGMNDASERVPAADYISALCGIMEGVSKVIPQTEFLLVATMRANPQWTFSCPELYKSYLEALGKLVKPGVALADMTTMWAELIRQKSYLDLTGNGMNHPNDFGHSIYAQLITATILGDEKKRFY
jgi:lysophospholipase L1-like esterase